MSDPVSGSQATRLQRLEDLEAIRRVVLDYATLVDAREIDRAAQLFAEDAEFDLGFMTVIGPAGAKQAWQSMVGDLLHPEPGRDFHVSTNAVVDVDGDRATSRSMWQFVTPDATGHPRIAHFGHYDDAFVRVGGVWRFARRAALRDIGVAPEEFS
jgi:ketosteroid isomerase-like protein